MALGDVRRVAVGPHYPLSNRLDSVLHPVRNVDAQPLGTVGVIMHTSSGAESLTIDSTDYTIDSTLITIDQTEI